MRTPPIELGNASAQLAQLPRVLHQLVPVRERRHSRLSRFTLPSICSRSRTSLLLRLRFIFSNEAFEDACRGFLLLASYGLAC